MSTRWKISPQELENRIILLLCENGPMTTKSLCSHIHTTIKRIQNAIARCRTDRRIDKVKINSKWHWALSRRLMRSLRSSQVQKRTVPEHTNYELPNLSPGDTFRPSGGPVRILPLHRRRIGCQDYEWCGERGDYIFRQFVTENDRVYVEATSPDGRTVMLMASGRPYRDPNNSEIVIQPYKFIRK